MTPLALAVVPAVCVGCSNGSTGGTGTGTAEAGADGMSSSPSADGGACVVKPVVQTVQDLLALAPKSTFTAEYTEVCQSNACKSTPQ